MSEKSGPVRLGVNGFGRIGRNFLRAVLAREVDIDVVAINDLVSAEMNAYLLSYDSTFGRLDVQVKDAEVKVYTDAVEVAGRRIRILSQRDPSTIAWGELGVDVVIESTGRFTKREEAEAHLEAGARKVIISAPSKNADITVVMGVNDDAFDPAKHEVISNASCTTNCFVPMVKVIDDAFGLKSGLMTTVHSYTNDQNLLDLPHKDFRRARAAGLNIVPTTTGAARATNLVIKAMEGKLDGTALRVPLPVGSITDFTAVIPEVVSVDEVNGAFYKAASSPPLSAVLEYNDKPIVSSDIVGCSASCIFDATLTIVMPIDKSSTLVKVMGWYDNEWGYSNRLADLALLVGKKGV
ncbi:MAG: type I glyceraldehyde-3-phosphate dehydrogenase [Actinobacteria bacterium]|nr:type I glyceraldehyde-3-phosphate dehydrogenase [Actinomycetota bacterium]MCL6104469.1 type I glyceraldehyde-3-phosphate dehydrogenase [Actinomycetota bacterium]